MVLFAALSEAKGPRRGRAGWDGDGREMPESSRAGAGASRSQADLDSN